MKLLNDKPSGDKFRSIEEREGRFLALVRATSDIVFSMSPDWSVMTSLAGRGFLSDANQPIVDWMVRYIPPDDHNSVAAAIQRASERRMMFESEHRVLRADGSVGWTLSRAVPVFNDDGEVVEWFGTSTDITERRKVEQELRQAKEDSEQQKRVYEAIASGTPDLIYVFDLEYRFTYANDALLTMWGKTWDEAIGRRLTENGYEDWHAAMHEREIDQVRATKQPIRGEVSFPHAVLGRRIYDYIFTPVLNDEGEVTAVAGTTRDITDIRKAEMAVSESEVRFRMMAEGMDVLIVLTDDQGREIYFNKRWEALLGTPVAFLHKGAWLNHVFVEDRKALTEMLATGTSEQKQWQCEFRLTDCSEENRWLLARSLPRFLADGSFAGSVISAVDITEMKADEQRKNDFISMVSHELKTPLTSALGYIQILQRRTQKNGDTSEESLLRSTARQLSKMANLINSFLNVSRLESGKLFLERQVFDMAILLKELEAEIKTSGPKHRFTFDAADAIWVTGDREKIGQVIQNLVSNAEKYSPQQSSICVSCAEDGDRVLLRVTDEGFGLNQEDIPKIFERFYRIESDKTKSVSGFGIGLYLCSEIIRAHGGEIGVESTLGKGSSFYFSLPRGERGC